MLKYSKASPSAQEPNYAHEGDACFDLYACESASLGPKDTVVVSTGLRFQIPEGYMLEMRSRSGLAKRGIVVANAPATVDSSYAGVVGVLLLNTGGSWTSIDVGDRIAQGLLVPVEHIEFEEVDDGWQDSYSERGEGSFGSTGR